MKRASLGTKKWRTFGGMQNFIWVDGKIHGMLLEIMDFWGEPNFIHGQMDFDVAVLWNDVRCPKMSHSMGEASATSVCHCGHWAVP